MCYNMIALKDVIFVKACIYTLGCKVNAYESEYKSFVENEVNNGDVD